MEFTVNSTSNYKNKVQISINSLEELMEIIETATQNHKGVIITDYKDGDLPNIEIYDDDQECNNCACR